MLLRLKVRADECPFLHMFVSSSHFRFKEDSLKWEDWCEKEPLPYFL